MHYKIYTCTINICMCSKFFLLDIANEFISNSEGSKLLDVLNFDYRFFQYLFVLVGVVN